MPSEDSDKIEQRIDISGQAGNVTQIGKIVIRISQFVDEKIFKRFGLEQRVGFIGVAVLVIGSAFTLYWALRPQSPVHMTGDFNIAITQFQVVGRGDGLDDAQELAQSFANAIDREMSGLADEIKQRIEVRPPQESGSIMGATEEKRAENAHILAEKINADVVIYGMIEVNDKAATIKPEFYVRSDDFTATAEVTGQYRMGSEISIDKVDNIARKREVGNILADRFRALTFIVYGIADFVVGKYEDAEINFSEALKIKGWDNPDVIYVMLGNTALRQHDLMDAERYYRQGLEANPIYSRAYAGLGGVLYFQALGDTQSDTYDTVNIERLNQSIETYQQALDPSLDRPPLADITTKVNFSLGQAYLLKANIESTRNSKTSEQDLALAMQAFHAVIQDYGEGSNPRVEELAAHAHARLGLIYRLTSQLEKAISEYEQALNILPPLDQVKEHRASYEAALGDIYVKLKQPSKAIEWYERAVANALPGSYWEKRYQETLDGLR
ncbi:MAG: tetratricopeptide repeat protein [Anaerolineae bacterium]|nr:tetratricopeptide repeat protein [Anaerolineae bacterium]